MIPRDTTGRSAGNQNMPPEHPETLGRVITLLETLGELARVVRELQQLHQQTIQRSPESLRALEGSGSGRGQELPGKNAELISHRWPSEEQAPGMASGNEPWSGQPADNLSRHAGQVDAIPKRMASLLRDVHRELGRIEERSGRQPFSPPGEREGDRHLLTTPGRKDGSAEGPGPGSSAVPGKAPVVVEQETNDTSLEAPGPAPGGGPIHGTSREQRAISGTPVPKGTAIDTGSYQGLERFRVREADRLRRAAAWWDGWRSATGVPAALLLAGVGVWATTLTQIAPRDMSNLGLVSVLPPAFFAALGLLTVGFLVAVSRTRTPTLVLFLYVVALIIIIHGTPPLVYGTVRYAWTWKHIGLVDYVQRFGSVDPTIDAYHSWPGFFALAALGLQTAGVDSAIGIAMWAQPAFNLLFLGPLLLVLKALTNDRRVVWLGSWFFFSFNWVGQDYFSPQAFAYVLHLTILGICLHWFGRSDASPWEAIGSWRVAMPFVFLFRRLVPSPRHNDGPPVASPSPGQRIAMLLFVIALFAVIAASHQLTPFMTLFSVTALVIAGRCGVRGLPILMAVGTATWVIFVATAFLNGHLSWLLESAFRIFDNVANKYVELPESNRPVKLIAMVDSGLSASVLLLAMLGCFRRLRQGYLDLAAIVLLLAPAAMVAGNSYGGEMLFRVYFFALPFAAFFAAALLYTSPAAGRSSWTLVFSLVLSFFLLAGLLLASYGKERMNFFTPGEMAAAEYLYQTAPQGSLWLDGTWNWPHGYRRYEQYSYQSLMGLPSSQLSRLYDDPVAEIANLMQNGKYPDAFLTITRSQKMYAETDGVMRQGSLDRIEVALQQSERFSVVFRNDDAIIFKLRHEPKPGDP